MSRATDLVWSSPAFLENYSYTITKLSELITDKRPGNIVDRLVESGLLTHDQRATIDSENDAALAARRILDTLVRKEDGSFRKFCIAVRNTGRDQELYGTLIRSSYRSQSSAYGTDALNSTNDLRTMFAPDSNRHSDLETRTGPPPEMSLQSGIWQVEREKPKDLKVFVNLFLQQYDKEEWKVHAVCCHQKEEAEKTEERYKKKSWKSSDDWWEFPLNDESEDKVIVQLADDMKEYWSQEEDIVLQRSSLMSSANTSQRIKEKKSLPAKSLHFKAKYGKDGNATFNSVNTFSFLLSPELERESLPPRRQEEQATAYPPNTTEEQLKGQEKRVQHDSESQDPGSNWIPVAVVVVGVLVIIAIGAANKTTICKWTKEVSKKVTYR
ncbi:uncharacterized protein [Oscarella lobularis]|uniref:uncharacterized protein n=1 Tax=Oscarella lobularis TaxID=121494 RepID=UPI00331449D7